MPNVSQQQVSAKKIKKQASAKISLELIHPKYRIGELIRARYGELNTRKGKLDLMFYCKLKNERTVNEWLNIEAGEPREINHLLIDKVLHFFELKKPEQLLTDAHKKAVA